MAFQAFSSLFQGPFKVLFKAFARLFQAFRGFCKAFSRLFEMAFKAFSSLFQGFFKAFSLLLKSFFKLFQSTSSQDGVSSASREVTCEHTLFSIVSGLRMGCRPSKASNARFLFFRQALEISRFKLPFNLASNTQLSHREGTVGAHLMPHSSKFSVKSTTKTVLSLVSTSLQVPKGLSVPRPLSRACSHTLGSKGQSKVPAL
eukprot:405865-Amphidinium_carterae.1